MTTLKEAFDQLAKGHELDNEQKKLIIDKWQKELDIQPCEDAISRAEALKAINKMDIPEDMSVFEIKSHIGVEIGTLPPVQPKPKTGQWIYEKRKRLINETDEGAEYVTDYWCKCSKCGGDFGYRKMKDAFCEYCGAKMIEPQESE